MIQPKVATKVFATLYIVSITAVLMPNGLDAQCPTSDVYLRKQIEVDTFELAYPGCFVLPTTLFILGDEITSLSGLSHLVGVDRLSIQNTALTTLEGLNGITAVEGQVYIARNNSLQSLAGLENLETAGNGISIDRNESLKSSISSMTSLRSVTGNGIDIGNNPALEALFGPASLRDLYRLTYAHNNATEMISGFSGLETVTHGFAIHANSSLMFIEGFDALTEVGDDCCTAFRFRDNTSLLDISGFNALNRVVTRLDFTGNDALVDISGFRNLRVLESNLNIWENASLTSISGFGMLDSILLDVEFSYNDAFLDMTFLDSLKYVGSNLYIEYNDGLMSLEGLENLNYVGDGAVIRDNPLLSDCLGICHLVGEMGVGNWGWAGGNLSGCGTVAEVEANCDPPAELRIVDANVQYINNSWPFPGANESVLELTLEEVLALESDRNAVAADGVTEVVLIAEFEEEGLFDFEFNGMALPAPWGNSTFESKGKHYGLVMFKAPEVFPGSVESDQNELGLAVEQVEVSVILAGDPIIEQVYTIAIVRPPVVLIHGTYSNPVSTWRSGFEAEKSMYDVLREAGFWVSTVDYSSTNGSDEEEDSSFEANKMVVWENDGGIEDALETYRSSAIAVTRADVIGHSLGGVLPRVYASNKYHPEYERLENFMEGDINRLITIASTHYGSHLGEYQFFMNELSLIEDGPYNALLTPVASYAASWFAGTPATAAVRDQLPGSNALALIGEVKVPSHAITCQVDYGKMAVVEDPDGYGKLFTALAWGTYLFGPWDSYLDAKLEKLANPAINAGTTADGNDWKKVFPGMTDEEIYKKMMTQHMAKNATMFSVLTESFEMAPNIEIFDPVLSDFSMSDGDESWKTLFAPNTEPIVNATLFNPIEQIDRVTYQEQLKTKFSVWADLFRYLIFDNDHNDGTVRVESQMGRLPESSVTHLKNVWHGPAPKYQSVQNRLVELLDQGLKDFHAEGFPVYPAPNVNPPLEGSYGYFQHLFFPPQNLGIDRPERTRQEAICRSGMVNFHAEAYAQVAQSENAVIMVRPVNPDATTLLIAHAATKAMDVKPKSSNWGPQKGYLPRYQRYSKIWRVFKDDDRTTKIKEYDVKADKNVQNGIAVTTHLKVKLCEKEFWIHVDSNIIENGMDDAEKEVVIVPVNNSEMVCQWEEDGDDIIPGKCRGVAPSDRLGKFWVMASPTDLDEEGVPRVLTADYDFLMFGVYKGPNNPYDPPLDIAFRSGIGQMTDRQLEIMDELNEAVRIRGYDGGKVTHHGPENQFFDSPYVDYPITVFAPNQEHHTGDIISIPMGPKGFRDIHLKQYINEKRVEGYDLYDNKIAPGWKWTWNETAHAFDLADSKHIGDYVEELKSVHCDKNGVPESTNPSCRQIQVALMERTKQEEPEGRDKPHFQIIPNPVIASELSIYVNTNIDQRIQWRVLDVFGNLKQAGSGYSIGDETIIQVQLPHMEPGMYYLATDSGWTGKFIKL